ncbi:MAG: gliding motility-associated C-terminal domain-containing protein [Saprospiraceae bacterium]|nr:gliding motility-associated C-terminal domain-containing protein [Saprospiraceae bacterium]
MYFASNETLKLYKLEVSTCEVEEVVDLSFPYYLPDFLRYITALVFHPNGKVYAVNTTHLMELDMKTGALTVAFSFYSKGDSGFFPIWVGMGIDDQNLINLGWYSLWKYDPKIDTIVWSTRAGFLSLANFVMYKNLLFSNHLDRFELITYDRVQFGQLDKWEVPGLSEMTAMTIYYGNCDDTIIYGIDHNLENQSRLYTIDPVAHTLDTLCELDVNLITAISSPEVYKNPFVQPDLDLDNSSGHPGDGYWTLWGCDGVANICDQDVGINSCGPIDRITIVADPADELFGADLQYEGEGKWIWLNTDDYDLTEIEKWLVDLWYKTKDISKEKTVITYLDSGEQTSEVWTIVRGRDDPFVVDSMAISLCINNNQVIDLDSFFQLEGEEIIFDPVIPGSKFDPLVQSEGWYHVVRKYPCSDSAWVHITIQNPPQGWPLDPEIICTTDTINFANPYGEDVEFYWFDNINATRRIAQAGVYAYQIDDGACSWRADFTVSQGEECGCQVFVPNAFTPNDDGINDVLSLNPEEFCMRIQQLQIFDRNGWRVFESSDPDPRWDGGDHVPGVYLYLLNFFDYKINRSVEKSGSVTLIR